MVNKEIATYAVQQHFPGCSNVSGSDATQHIVSLKGVLFKDQRKFENGLFVIYDLSGIEAVTGSYLRRTIIWMIRCARASAIGLERSTAELLTGNTDDSIEPINIFPVVAGITDEIAEELNYVLSRYSLVCLEAIKWDDKDIQLARLHGVIDKSLWTALQSLSQEQDGATAAQLHSKHPEEKINPTGWNNRLSDLHAMRLANRSKQGRFWVYCSVSERTVE